MRFVYSLTAEEKSYLGGFFDGEGCICIIKTKCPTCIDGYRYRLIVKISNTNKKIIDIFHKFFGGYIYEYNRKNCRTWWVWQLRDRDVLKFLRHMRRFILLKKPQLENAIDFLKTKRRKKGENGKFLPKDEEIKWLQEELYKRNKKLNRGDG